jgi:hypothetical protein
MIDITVHAPAEVPYSSHFIAGLLDLSAEGFCNVRFRPGDQTQLQPGADLFSTVVVVRHQGGTTRCLLDLCDKTYQIAATRLADCDLCFKRNLVLGELPIQEYHEKFRPNGLIFPCRSRHDKRAWRRLAWLARESHLFPMGKDLRARLSHVYFSWRRYYKLSYVDQFEAPPTTPVDDYIMFQTRTWHDDLLNNERADLIRRLRKELGSRFVGGFVPNATAKKQFPDCLTNAPADQRSYLALTHRAKGVIYSRGIKSSPAWKLGEYFAGSKAIVAEPPPTALPTPLRHEQHLLAFSDHDECLAHCERLLGDADLVSELRHNALKYYQSDVCPSASAKRIVQTCIEHAASTLAPAAAP